MLSIVTRAGKIRSDGSVWVIACFVCLCSWAVGTCRAADSWPQFRGPSGQGDAGAANLPDDWTHSDYLLWKTKVPGRGWSSPVVMDGQVWLTTGIEMEASAELRAQQLEGDRFAGSKEVSQSVMLHAVGIDLHSGTQLYNVHLVELGEPVPIHSLNSYASPTPVLEAGRLYCHFGRFGVFCVEMASGRIVWRNQLKETHSVGPGSSPILAGPLLILTCDGLEEQYMVGLDKATGEIVWRTNRPPLEGDDTETLKSFTTPLLIETANGQQLFSPGAQWVAAYDPPSGKELWRMRHGKGFSLVPRPVEDDGVVYFYSGFSGQGLFAIRTDGHDDVTDSHVVWNQPDVASTRPSAVIVDARIYTVTERGMVSCVQAVNGEVVWRKRLRGNFSASLVVSGDRIHAFSEDGVVTIFRTGDEYEKIAEHDLAERIMASPAVIGDSILVRTESHLLKIGSP
ncbi:MAG: PQQ-binding-like beta-propeller repeat protein [Pirellulaceae bacterium]|nr:PQQ-binding-like beta-propeller repeat protein [Pirellulaceae bacterium]